MKVLKNIVFYLLTLTGLIFTGCGQANHERSPEAIINSIKADSMMISGFEFEKDSLSDSSLRAFEVRAAQKLRDVADLIQIMSDTSIEQSFREQAKQMMISTFLKGANTITFKSDDNRTEKLTITQLTDSLLANTDPKLEVEVTGIESQQNLQRKKAYTYEGSLSFNQSIYQRRNGSLKLTKHNMKISIVVKRIVKKFGTSSKEVWEVLLGNVEINE